MKLHKIPCKKVEDYIVTVEPDKDDAGCVRPTRSCTAFMVYDKTRGCVVKESDQCPRYCRILDESYCYRD